VRRTVAAVLLCCVGPARAAGAEKHELTVVGEGAPRSASEATRDKRVTTIAPHRTGGDLLRVVPGAFVTQHSGSGKAYQIFFRGFDAVHGQDLAIDVGGAPVNEISNVHGQGYADLHFIMPEVVRELRSTPGPYAPWQGDFAVAGSLRVALGMDEPGVTTKATYGSFGERRVFLGYRPEGADAATFGAFESWETSGFGPSRAASRTSAIGQHAFAVGRGFTLRVLMQAYASRFDSAGVLRRDDVSRDRLAVYDPRQGGASSRTSLVLDLGSESWSLAPFVVLRSLQLRQNFTGFLEQPFEGDNNQQRNDAVTLGAHSSYRKGPIEAGLYLRHDWIDQAQRSLGRNDTVLATTIDARVRATNVAGYVDVAVKPVKRVSLRGGLRVDGLAYGVVENERARFAMGTHFGPKISADARVFGALHAIASYGEGFRSPQARSLADGETTPFTRVRSFELGVRYREAPWFSASLAGFRTSLTDDLVFNPATSRNERVGATTRLGAALEYLMTPTPWFVASGSATVTRATFAGGDAVPYVPSVVIREDLAFLPVLGALGRRTVRGHFGAALSALAGRPLPYGARGDDIFLVDASIGARVAELELRVDVFNVLGAEWFDGQFVHASRFAQSAPPSLVPTEHVTIGAPRTILGTLAVHL